jgi:N-glycosylase/DNA lyase
MKEWIDFFKIKLQLNENIEWHYMHLELNWNEMKLNSNLVELNSYSIEKKPNENWWRRYWKFSHEYGVEKFQHQKKKNLKNTPFHASLLGNGPNGF